MVNGPRGRPRFGRSMNFGSLEINVFVARADRAKPTAQLGDEFAFLARLGGVGDRVDATTESS